jgi:hypothetical protein
MAASAGPAATPGDREFYELRLYHLESRAKQKRFDDFCARAAVPALNRLEVGPVGVFRMMEGDSSDLYVLLPHKSAQSFITLIPRLAEDPAFLDAGAEFLGAPFDAPAYQRFESSLSIAFEGHPKITVPSTKHTRVFQLRIYESHNTERARKKIEMFNTGGEIDIFHRTGLNPVFFGDSLIGAKLPNLTYMLGFDDEAALKAGWDAFRADPGWLELKGNEEYKETVSNITNILLRPMPSSQI